MLYGTLKANLLQSKKEKLKAQTTDLIGVIDAVDKEVFAERKLKGDDFLVKDDVVIKVIKNQVKNINKDLAHISTLPNSEAAVDQLVGTVTFLSSFLPARVEGDDLRLIIQSLGANNLGQAMGLLKKRSAAELFDYDGAEAAAISKEIFV